MPRINRVCTDLRTTAGSGPAARWVYWTLSLLAYLDCLFCENLLSASSPCPFCHWSKQFIPRTWRNKLLQCQQ